MTKAPVALKSPALARLPPRAAVMVIGLAQDAVLAGGTIADLGGANYRSRVRSMLPRLATLLATARLVGIRVLYATDAHEPGDYELRHWPPHAMRGTWQAEITAEVAPEPQDLVLTKRSYSAFRNTKLELVLRTHRIERLYLTGLLTDGCVRHTAADAFQLGFDLVWVTDALDALTPDHHTAAMEDVRTWYAADPDRQFLSAAQAQARWLGNPATADSPALSR